MKLITFAMNGVVLNHQGSKSLVPSIIFLFILSLDTTLVYLMDLFRTEPDIKH